MKHEFIPALRYRFLTPFYDAFIKLTLPEERLKQKLIDWADIRSKEKILDFGCGTGTALLLLKKSHPWAEITGIDNDPQILKIAHRKVAAASMEVHLMQYKGYKMPLAEHSFDAVVSSWVFHHLYTRQKFRAFRDIYRVLKPGGRLVIADWGKPTNLLMRTLFFGVQLVDNFMTTQANVEGKLPSFAARAGFINIEELATSPTIFGTLSYYRAFKPLAVQKGNIF